MKKILGLFMAVAFFLSANLHSYAAVEKVDSATLKALNTVNFSSASYDHASATKKWLDSNYNNKLLTNDLYWIFNGHTNNNVDVAHIKFLVNRQVVSDWKKEGKADAKLGQLYVSQTNLLIGEINWYTSALTTKAWVKNVSGKATLTKVQYTLVSRAPNDSDKIFRSKSSAVVEKNSYYYVYHMFQNALERKVAAIDSDEGIKIVPNDQFAFISDSLYYGCLDVTDLSENMDYKMADIVITKDLILGVKGGIYGFGEDGDYRVSLVEKGTNTEAEYDGGFLLKAGKAYELRFTGEKDISPAFNNTLFFKFKFSILY